MMVQTKEAVSPRVVKPHQIMTCVNNSKAFILPIVIELIPAERRIPNAHVF